MSDFIEYLEQNNYKTYFGKIHFSCYNSIDFPKNTAMLLFHGFRVKFCSQNRFFGF